MTIPKSLAAFMVTVIAGASLACQFQPGEAQTPGQADEPDDGRIVYQRPETFEMPYDNYTLSGIFRKEGKPGIRIIRPDEVTPEILQGLLQTTLSDMVYVAGGEFMMGDAGLLIGDRLPWTHGKDNKPPHPVRLDGYYLSRFETTYWQHDIFSASTERKPLYERFAGYEVRSPYVAAGGNWHAAKNYCLWLAERSALPFDLPTEAQWEYAARNRGDPTVFAATDTGQLDIGRNYDKKRRREAAPGLLPPNPLGLYGMSGNVMEWVNDWYGKDYYQNSPVDNPKGPSRDEATIRTNLSEDRQGKLKVLRGGWHAESPSGSNVYTRQEEPPEFGGGATGFRCALNFAGPPEELAAQAETLGFVYSPPTFQKPSGDSAANAANGE